MLLHRSILPPASCLRIFRWARSSLTPVSCWWPWELVPHATRCRGKWCFLLSSYLSIPYDTLCAFTTARAAVFNLPKTAHTLVFLVRRPSPLISITLYLFEKKKGQITIGVRHLNSTTSHFGICPDTSSLVPPLLCLQSATAPKNLGA